MSTALKMRTDKCDFHFPEVARRLTEEDSILKIRDITLPTKVCPVKAMIFPVVIYGCESWTIKKAECRS